MQTTEAQELEAILTELRPLLDKAYPLTSRLDPRFPTYTRVGTVEIFPDASTPAMWSSTGEGLERVATRIAIEMGILPKGARIPFQGIFYGLNASNVSSYYFLNRRLPGAPWWPWGKAAQALIAEDPDLLSGWAPPASLRDWLADLWRRLRSLRSCSAFERAMLAEVEPRERELARLETETAQRDYSALSARELLAEMQQRGNSAALVRLHMGVTFLIGSHYIKLRTALARYTTLPVRTTAAGLLVSLGDIESTKAAKALRGIAVIAREAPRLAALLRQRDLDGFARAVAAPADDAERRVAQARADFLHQYGYRGIGEAALDAKTWAEDPKQADAMVALYVDDGSGQANLSGAERREALEAEVLDSIRNPRQRRHMARCIANAQRFAALREHTKSLTVRQSLRSRKIVNALATKLVEEGVLEREDDRDMLTFRELAASIDKDRAETRALIARRRRAYELFLRLDIEELTFTGLPTLRVKTFLRAERTVPLGVGETLKGLAVSPGRVEGTARIVLDPRLDADIQPGEILVAPFTDAAWSPVFLMASGVVIDSGMPISHGATLARELGLPAVVNVPGTQRLRTGDRIRLDANSGEVTLLSRPEQAPITAQEPAVTTVESIRVAADDARLLGVARAIRLKGQATPASVAINLATTPEAAQALIDDAVANGIAEAKGRFWRLTPAGADWHDRALDAQRPRDGAAAEQLYARFLPLNDAFKQLAFDWQMRDATTPNDHADAAYDQAVLARLPPVHLEALRIAAEAAALAPRLAAFHGRFEQALLRLEGGDAQYLMSPRVDSYHTIWFEFHEELIDIAGRTRAQEAAEGRAA